MSKQTFNEVASVVSSHSTYQQEMLSLDSRLGLFVLLSATVGCSVAILDVAATPFVFENLGLEIVLVAPLAIWLVARLLRTRRPGFFWSRLMHWKCVEG